MTAFLLSCGLPELNFESLQALVDVGAVVDKRTGSIKPNDVIDPRFLERKNEQILKRSLRREGWL